jgi:hypothetical protein
MHYWADSPFLRMLPSVLHRHRQTGNRRCAAPNRHPTARRWRGVQQRFESFTVDVLHLRDGSWQGHATALWISSANAARTTPLFGSHILWWGLLRKEVMHFEKLHQQTMNAWWDWWLKISTSAVPVSTTGNTGTGTVVLVLVVVPVSMDQRFAFFFFFMTWLTWLDLFFWLVYTHTGT